MYRRIILLFLSSLLVATTAHANWMGNIQLQYDSPEYLSHETRVEVSFDYEVTNPSGMRVQAYPWCVDDTYPDFSWSGGPTLHGSGSQTLWFKLNSGALTIDHVKVLAWDPVSLEIIFNLDLPVRYIFRDHAVFDLQLSHSAPSWIAHGDELFIDFRTSTTFPDGAKVYIRPFTNGSPTPGYGASGFSNVTTGEDTGTQWFRFNADATVDEIRVRLMDASAANLYLEFFQPVEHHWREHGVSNIVLDPPPPAWLSCGMRVSSEFDYHTSHPGDVGIWARGAYDDVICDNQTFQGSVPVTTPSGHTTRWFTMATGFPNDANQVLFQMAELGVSTFFWEPVEMEGYHFGDHGIFNIQFTPGSTALVGNANEVDYSFDYASNWPNDIKVVVLPLVDGQFPAGGYQSAGFPALPSGTGGGSGWFRIPTLDSLVDQVRFRMHDATTGQLLLEFRVDTQIFFGRRLFLTDVPETPGRQKRLEQNHPNPFNPRTSISFSLPRELDARLRVYDLRGRHVVDLWDGPAPEGTTTVQWDGRDANGRALPSGVYVYRLTSEGVAQSRRMVLVR